MNWRKIDYGSLEALWLFLVIAVFLFTFISLYRYRRKKLASLADPSLLSKIQEPRHAVLFWLKAALFCFAWGFGVLALMQPQGNGRYLPLNAELSAQPSFQLQGVRQVMQDVVFLIDASLSMNVDDTRNGKKRLDEAKDIAEEIMSRLWGQRVALYAFTSTTMQLVPLTQDYLFSRLQLRELSANEGETAGTDLHQALEKMNQQFLAQAAEKQTFLIVMSDGGDTYAETLQGNDLEIYSQSLSRLLTGKYARYQGVYVVGLGSSKGKQIPDFSYKGKPVVSALNEKLLRQLSRTSGGELLLDKELATSSAADAILEGIKKEVQFEENIVPLPRIAGGQDAVHYDLYFQLPLGIAILALSLALLLPEHGR